MSVNATIAQGFRGIELPNPLDAYARVQQNALAQQQSQLNALKMQEYQREVESENRLRALYARPGVNTQSPEFLQEVYAVSPTKGAAMQKSALEVQKSQRESDKAAADIAATRMKMARDLLPSVTSPEAYANWRSYTLQNLPGLSNVIPEQYSPETTRNLMLEADKALEQHFVTQNTGGASRVIAMPKFGEGPARTVQGTEAQMTMAPAKATPAETEEIVMRLQDPNLPPPLRRALQSRLTMLTTREPKEPRELRTQQVTMNDGTLGIMNMDTGQVTPASLGGAPVKGKPSAFAEKNAAQRKQLALDLDRTIAELTSASKKDGLIDQSTGSGAGRLVDIGAAFVGTATPGAIAAGKLAPIADMTLKMVPRFEGPQSDKDTKSYKEAAGQLADTTLPNEIRKNAALEIIRLLKARKDQFVSAEMAAEGAGPRTAPKSGVDSSNPLLRN